MQLTPHLAQVQDQLSAAAALGDDRTREIAAALATAAAPAVRLAVLNALSAAADEITAALLDHPGSPSVSIGLDDDDVQVSIRDTAAQPGPTEARTDDGDTSARISLRLSESLKSDIEDAAAKDGVSVNTWLVRSATWALSGNPFTALSEAFGARRAGPRGGHRGGPHPGHPDSSSRITGWING